MYKTIYRSCEKLKIRILRKRNKKTYNKGNDIFWQECFKPKYLITACFQ